ncbi:glycosyl hydrolase [Herbidospora galbida]|uniref:Glycosyl hydrolase n=1 Tax=Herbidospora galbida TaxID=2575442 RepID=A0A4U3MBD0_9ACTN|nr:glycoside hydrolase family 3 C-terminal domain-containing protein [Herbidospora galbida]TKK85639.1 glycosyl hydrolase [Herbidospora galbida]
MDLDRKAALIGGQDMWTLPAAPEIGLPSLVTSDGPIGVRGHRWIAGDPAIALPSPTALAATWDVGLARRVGELLAAECRRKGVHVLLAPTVNLHRSPLGGRHFECFSEDPLLTGELGAAYVAGVQSGGVGVTVKHFVANDSETDRMTVDVRVDERTLREVYLAPFELVVRRARPWGVMAAYNGVNGVPMCEHTELIEGVLRGEWGFDGVVMSDWGAARDAVRCALGGLDLAMPGPGSVYGEPLARAVLEGLVPEELLDRKVAGLGRLLERVDLSAAESPDGVALAREVAARSATLLANDGVLPLAPAARVALIGGLAADPRILGGGSALVFPEHAVSPLEGLTAAGVDVTFSRGADAGDRVAAAVMAATATARDAAGRVLGEFPLRDGSLVWLGDVPVPYEDLHTVEISGILNAAPGWNTLAVEGAGRFVLEADGQTLFDGVVRPAGDDPMEAFFLPPQHEVLADLPGPVVVSLIHTVVRAPAPPAFVGFALCHRPPRPTTGRMISEAVAAAEAADVAVVVVGTSKEVESEGFDRTSLRLPGRQDELVARVAAANPRTVVVVNAGSPVEMPWRDEVAAILLTWFPGQEGGHALADVLTGAAEPGGRLPTTWPAALGDCPVTNVTPAGGVLSYDEGRFIGYRAWDRHDTAPAFPFGHGLGYTTWSYDEIAVDGMTVTVTLTNTGDRPGREVVQVYLAPEDPGDRPARWLAAFTTCAADPGQTVSVTVEIPRRAVEIWTEQGWQAVPGAYRVLSGLSVSATKLAI